MKKILSFLCALSIIGLSTSQVLSCNFKSKIPTPWSTSKSNLSNKFFYEDSVHPQHSWDIHGLRNGNSLKNLKKAIYQYILKEYNAANSSKTAITLEDVKNDLSLKIFNKNKELTSKSNIQNFTKYSVSISANKNAKYFLGSNNKNKFTVDLTQVDVSKFFNSELSKVLFKNVNKPEVIKTGIETEISKWYNDQEKSITHSVPEAITSAEVDNKLDIKVTPNSANFIKQKHWDLSYQTKKKNNKYFLDVNKPTGLKDKIKDYFFADFKDISLDKIYSAVNGQDLYHKVYIQAANLVNSSSNQTSSKVTPEDIKNDKNFKLSIFYIPTRNKHIAIKDTTATFPHEQSLYLNFSINKNDKYFLPCSKTVSTKHINLTKITLDNLNYQNYDISKASQFKDLKTQTASKLAQSVNKTFKTNISAADILKTNLSWIFYDKTTKRVVKPSKDVPNFDDEYTISLRVGDDNPYFDNNQDVKKQFQITDFTLNTNDLSKKFTVNNIKNLTSSKNLYDQVYTNLVNEYNHYYQGKRTKITIADLKKDQKLNIKITNKATKKILDQKDTTNSLKIKTDYQVDVNIKTNDFYFRTTQKSISTTLNVKKLFTINKKDFDFGQKGRSLVKISQIRNYLYTQLANQYNAKLNVKLPKISAQTLIKDKNLKLKIDNGKKKLAKDEINFNENVLYYLTTTNNDQYFGKFTNLQLGQISYQKKIDLGTQEAKNYLNNEEKVALNNRQIKREDVIRWIMRYLNSTKQFSKKLTWDMVAPDKDSVKLWYNSHISLKPIHSFVLTVNNSPYLKAGKFTFLENNFRFDTDTMSSAVPSLKKTHWAYNDFYYHVNPGRPWVTPTIAHAIQYIAFFELNRIYSVLCNWTNCKLGTLNNKVIYDWIATHKISFLWSKNNDGKYRKPTYNEKISSYGPTYYQFFVVIHKNNPIFSVTNKPVELINFYFSYYS